MNDASRYACTNSSCFGVILPKMSGFSSCSMFAHSRSRARFFIVSNLCLFLLILSRYVPLSPSSGNRAGLPLPSQKDHKQHHDEREERRDRVEKMSACCPPVW